MTINNYYSTITRLSDGGLEEADPERAGPHQEINNANTNNNNY